MQFNKPKSRRKILLLTANPIGTVPLRQSEEHKRIEDSRIQFDRQDKFEVCVEPAVTITSIQQALLKHEPAIVHFCGHGAGIDGIVCEDESGHIKLIPTAALSNLFNLVSANVKCVVLNACYTEIQAKEIVKNIEFVVGMKKPIGDQAALRFTSGFYSAFFAGKGFKDCYLWGVNAIQLDNIPEDLTPIILMKEPVEESVEKTVKVRPKKSFKGSINSTEEKPVAPSLSPHKPASGNPDPVLSASPTPTPVAGKPSLLRQMPKREFLRSAIALVSALGILSISKSALMAQTDLAGNYIQEGSAKDDLNQEGVTSKHIRRDFVVTTLTVFPDPKTGSWYALETTFLKYYYAPQLDNVEERYFIGSSKAEKLHTEYGRRGGKILMKGYPSAGQVGLKVEPLLGNQSLIDDIKKLVDNEIEGIPDRFNETLSEWTVDERGNLFKEKWNKGQDRSKRGTIEKFNRRD
jgi:hypothetical protein